MGKYDCILPWNHVRVWQTGKAWPCCQWVGETPEDMNVNNGDVMNHPLMVETRARMLEDKPVKGCSRCYRLERETGTSMRLDVNTGIFGGIGQDVDKMVPVHKDSEPKLRYLELSISNACNNSCRMCGPELSTHWYTDAKKIGMAIPKGIQYNPLNKTDLSNLRFLKLLGGEPLLHPKEIINILDRCDLPKLNLMLITNTTQRPTEEIIQRFKKLNKLTVTLSIDAFGPLNEFLRTGSNWEEVKANLHWFRKQNWCRLTVHGVITIYNVNCFMELHNYCRKLGVFANFMVVEGPEYMRPRHLPEQVKQQLLEKYEKEQKLSFVKDTIYELKQTGSWSTFRNTDRLMNKIRKERFEDYNQDLAEMISLT